MGGCPSCQSLSNSISVAPPGRTRRVHSVMGGPPIAPHSPCTCSTSAQRSLSPTRLTVFPRTWHHAPSEVLRLTSPWWYHDHTSGLRRQKYMAKAESSKISGETLVA